jgi:hypothetical protein
MRLVGLGPGLDKRKITSPCRESNHDFSVVQPIAQSLYYYYYYYYYKAEIIKTWKKKRELECDGKRGYENWDNAEVKE